MKRFLHITLSVVVTAITIAVIPLGHVNAMQSHGIGHSSPLNTSQHCTMLCTPANPTKEEKLKDTIEDDDDKSEPHLFTVSQTQVLSWLNAQHAAQSKYALSFEPPPAALGSHILFAVFRA